MDGVKKNQLKKDPLAIWLIFVLVLLIINDIFFIKKANNYVFALVSINWFLVNKKFKIDGRFSVSAGLFFLAFIPLFMLFNEALAERIGIWAFLFFIIGVFLFVTERGNKIS